MKKLGVMEIAHSLEYGGMERVVANLVRHFDPDRYRPMVCCIACEGVYAPELIDEGFPIFCLNKGPGVSLGAPMRLAEILREQKIDIVHMHNSGPLFTGTIAAIKAGVPVRVYTDHARVFPDRPRVMMTEIVVTRFVDRCIAVSEETRRNLRKYLRIPERNLMVVPNGIADPPPVDGRRRAEIRAEFGIGESDPLVVSAARLEPQKAIHRLIEAAATVREHVPAAKFLVAGGGALHDELRELVEARGLVDAFFLPGWRLDVPEMIGAGDVFALSSDWEGMPMSLLESMAMSKPAVCPNVGDVGVGIVDGKNGYVVEPGNVQALADALVRVLADPDDARRMGREGRALFEERFHARTMTRRYEEVFEEVLCRAG